MIKIAEHTFSRKKAMGYALIIGVLIGLTNTIFLPIDFTFRSLLFVWLAAAAVSVIILHESVHGGTAVLFGFKPIFGFKPPLIYITFTEKIPRGLFIAISLAPLIVLNLMFGLLFAAGILKVFSYFCLFINTLGATGDVWITLKLVKHGRGTLVQDTKTGIIVWQVENLHDNMNHSRKESLI